MLKFPLPSNDPLPVTEPVNEIVRAVANLVAVAALPDKFPIKFPWVVIEPACMSAHPTLSQNS